ncbi:MAG: MFS transporter [Christensenellales bacterium]
MTNNSDNMKLDIKRTLFVGFAFMGIMCFWEVYDYIMPLILSRYFGLNQAQYGIIMGLDNLLAIFLLPFFGHLSDKHNNAKLGRRTHYILFGTVAAVICLVGIAITEYLQYRAVVAADITEIETLVQYGLDEKYLSAEYQELYRQVAQTGVKPEGELLVKYNDMLNNIYNAQVACAGSVTKAKPIYFIMFMVALVLALISMASYRSPAVALMPDVTPKPLRSQANAIINIMGGAGGLISILLYTFLAKERYQSHVALFIGLAAVMLCILGLFLGLTREKKFVAMRYEEEKRWEIVDEIENQSGEKLPKEKAISLLLILGTVFLWFMGYNAVKSHLSTYATSVLNFKDSVVGVINIINGAGGAIAMLPVALMASKIGRKKSIIIGLALSVVAFVPCFFMTANTPGVGVLFPLCFVLSGFGLVCVNVNTFPMVTELSKGSNVGKYTGYYYISSMTAQALTPAFAGVFMDKISSNSVFVYAIIFVALAIVTCIFIKHGDNKPVKKQKVVEYFAEEE